MSRTRSLQPLLPVSIILAAVACDSGTDTGTLDDFRPAAVEEAILPLLQLGDITFDASASLYPAWDAITESHGAVFSPAAVQWLDRPDQAEPLRDADFRDADFRTAGFRTAGLRTAVFFPEEIRGKTFVFDQDQHAWVIDDSRQGAPANGIRIVYYQATSSGTIAMPVIELGYIELTDQDSETLNRLGTRVVRTSGGETVLADFTQGYRSTGNGSGETEHFESGGFFTDGTSRVDFTITLDHDAPSTGEEGLDLQLTLTSAAVTYTWSWNSAFDADGAFDDSYSATADHGDGVTRLDVDVTGSDAAGQDLVGTLAYRTAVVADIDLRNDGTFRATRPDGGSFGSLERGQIESLVFSLFYGGSFVLTSLPLL